MNEAQFHSVALATVFLITTVGLLLYRSFNPEHRPETLQLAISRCLLCAAAFILNAFVMSLDIHNFRLQALAAAPVNLTLIMMIAGICTLQARSLGTVDISPKARQLLRHTPHAFMVCFTGNFVMSMIWPVPVLERFAQAPPYYLLNRALVTVPEGFFLAVAVFVSVQAASVQEPVGRIRLQHLAFCGAQLLLVCTAVNTYSIVCFRVFIEDERVRRSLIDSAFVRELWFAAGAGALYVVGFALYYVNNERTRVIARFSAWRRARQELDQKLWALETQTFADRFPAYDLIPAAAQDLEQRAARENSEEDFSPADARKACETFKLFVLYADSIGYFSMSADAALASVIRYQEYMLREPTTASMSWPIASTVGGSIDYDLAQDPIPDAVQRLREIFKDRRPPRLVTAPQWFQLAAFAAAHSNILPHTTREQLTRTGAVMERVTRAYHNAALLRDLQASCFDAELIRGR